MIVPPAPTIESGLNAAGGAARNSATQATMSINVAALAYRPSQGHRSTPLPRAALDRQRHLHANRHLCTLAKRARTSTANAPLALSP
jgi:hypothetical protein